MNTSHRPTRKSYFPLNKLVTPVAPLEVGSLCFCAGFLCFREISDRLAEGAIRRSQDSRHSH